MQVFRWNNEFSQVKCKIFIKGNFFSINLQRARAAFESVPWVRRATVRRVWPDRLAVSLEEHRAAALWSGVLPS